MGSSRLRLAAIVAAIILVMGLLAGLGSALAQDSSPSPAGGKVTANFGWSERVDSLNPFIGYQGISYAVYYLNYDTLVNYDADTLQPEPGLAERWESSPDGKTWTFYLRKDVKWQDGEPFTADDVAFTFNYVVDNEMGAFTNYTVGIKHATVVDDYTVRFDCSQPKPSILQMWVPIFPEHIWSKIDPEDAQSTVQNLPPIIGTGAFQVVEWKKTDFVRMVANKDYWNGAPKVDELIFRSYTNRDTMVSDLKVGTIQWAEPQQAQFTELQNTAGFGTVKAQTDTFENLGMNCYTGGPSKGHPALKDPAFRRALNWAIDREQIATIAYAGAATPATGFLTTNFWKPPLDYHWEPAADQKYTYDLERAGQELDAAGYTDGDGDGVREYKGKPIELRLWAVTDKDESVRAGKLMAASLRQVGLRIEYRTVDDGTASDGMYNVEGGEFTPDYDLFVWYWDGDFDPGFLLSIFTTDQINSWSDCAWSNDEYDQLYKQQDAELDAEKRKELIWQMQEIVYDQSPYIVFAYAQALEAYDTANWEGWVHQPADTGTVENNWTYLYLQPRTAAVEEEGGTSTGLIVGIVIAAAVVVGLVVWLLRRGKGRVIEE